MNTVRHGSRVLTVVSYDLLFKTELSPSTSPGLARWRITILPSLDEIDTLTLPLRNR
jgi:hypothetical protein